MSAKDRPVDVRAAEQADGAPLVSGATERSMTSRANLAAQANLQMEREFYGRDEDAKPAEAVDPAQLFRNES